MKKLRILNKILLIVLFSYHFVLSGTGSSGGQFLQIGAGIRALSMGSAYVGLAEGVDAIYWNPAGLSKLSTNMHLSLGHTEYFADMTFDNFAFTVPGMGGVFGVFGVGLFSGDIEITTVEQPDGTDETYSANDYAFGISYARNMTDKFLVGISLKMVNQNIAELSSFGWAMDIGAIYNTGLLNNLRIGFAITNFGSDLRYTGDDLIFRTRVYKDETAQDEDVRSEYLTEEYQLPLKLQMGIAFDIINTENNKIVMAVDGINPNDQDETLGVGVEYTLMSRYSIRTGYSEINEKGFTAGFGLLIGSVQERNVKLDYAFENHSYLGELHRFGFDFAF